MILVAISVEMVGLFSFLVLWEWRSKSAVSTVDASHFMTSNSLQDLIASGKLYKQVDNKKSWRNFTAMVGYDGLAKMSATEYNVAVQAYTLAKHKGHLNLFADNIEAVVEQGTLIQWSQEIIAGLTEDAIGGDTYERTTA